MIDERQRVRTVTESARSEESTVPDLRGSLTPSQCVERKLLTLLRSSTVPVSRLQAGRPRGPR